MTYHQVCSNSNTTSGTGTLYPSGAPELAPIFFTWQGLCSSSCQITCLHVFSSVLWCRYDFHVKTMFNLSWLPRLLWGFMFYLCYLYLFKYTGVQHDFHIRWCSCRLTVAWRVSHVKQELLTTPEHLNSPPVYSGVCIARSLVFCATLCRSLFVFLSFFFWPLYSLSFFDLRLLITPLVSSNLFTVKWWQLYGILWVGCYGGLMPLLTIFQWYHGGRIIGEWNQEKTSNLFTIIFYHIKLYHWHFAMGGNWTSLTSDFKP